MDPAILAGARLCVTPETVALAPINWANFSATEPQLDELRDRLVTDIAF